MTRVTGLLLAGALLTGACGDDATGTDGAQASRNRVVPGSIVEVAQGVNAQTGEFSTLIAAVVAADLVTELSTTGQRTVFAPTDAAFAELGLDAAAVATLPKETLRNILLFHVTPGRRLAADVVGAQQIRMANGGFNPIRVESGDAYIGAAKIVAVDVLATNGVIHVIDAVLMP
jgi:uncharacterized surface protein with fasciclin (FAS1) repeats